MWVPGGQNRETEDSTRVIYLNRGKGGHGDLKGKKKREGSKKKSAVQPNVAKLSGISRGTLM